MSAPTLVRLCPGRWTPVPQTHYELRWDGAEKITVCRRGDAWDVSSASPPPGYLLVRIARAGRPVTPPWPILVPALHHVPGRGQRERRS